MKAITLILGGLCAAFFMSASAQTFTVAPNGKATERPAYKYNPPAGPTVGAATGRAKVGASCDCSTKIVNGRNTYCALSGVAPVRLALCAVPPVVVLPPEVPVDHSAGMPAVDKAKIPAPDPAEFSTAERIKTVIWRPDGGGNWLPCNRLTDAPDCGISDPANLTGDIGAFREIMLYAGMNNDDSLVFPAQPGKSHLHVYFGTLTDAFTTADTIGKCAGSYSAGGTLNCTSAWVPAMIDARNAAPVRPHHLNLYYKGNYANPENGANIVPVPVGLSFISGNAKNTDPAGAVNAMYICNGPNGENPGWKRTITAAVADGTCKPGGNLTMDVNFPVCWDGVNLDSPNHQAHMADLQQNQNPPFEKFCPASHPKQIPTISFNVVYYIQAGDDPSKWRLSCELDGQPAGECGHGDYRMGWSPKKRPDLFDGANETIVEHWTKHCLNERRDCHNYLLGDNRLTLY